MGHVKIAVFENIQHNASVNIGACLKASGL